MDYFSQKFSAAAKIIVADLRDIANKISFLRESIEQHSKTICTEDEGQEQDREVQPVWIKPILSKYDEAEGKRQANDDRHYRVQNSIRWATWSAFIAATIYAGIAAKQLDEMRKATKATQQAANTASESFISNQRWTEISMRPYLGLENAVLAIQPIAHDQLGIKVEIRNSGKTPAVNFSCHKCSMFLMGTDHTHSKESSLEPQPIDVASEGHRTLLFWTDQLLEESDVAAISNGTLSVYIRGRLRYMNIYDGRSYESPEFCYFYIAGNWENHLGPCDAPPLTNQRKHKQK